MRIPQVNQIRANKRYRAINHEARSQGWTHRQKPWRQWLENIRKAEVAVGQNKRQNSEISHENDHEIDVR